MGTPGSLWRPSVSGALPVATKYQDAGERRDAAGVCSSSGTAGAPGLCRTSARPDMVTGQPERKSSTAYVLQTASGETIPVLKEALFELTLGRRALRIWVFVAEVTDEVILGLDVLRAYDASVDLGRHLLRLGREEVTLWRPGTQPKSARPSLVGDVVIPARCERVVMA